MLDEGIRAVLYLEAAGTRRSTRSSTLSYYINDNNLAKLATSLRVNAIKASRDENIRTVARAYVLALIALY